MCVCVVMHHSYRGLFDTVASVSPSDCVKAVSTVSLVNNNTHEVNAKC